MTKPEPDGDGRELPLSARGELCPLTSPAPAEPPPTDTPRHAQSRTRKHRAATLRRHGNPTREPTPLRLCGVWGRIRPGAARKQVPELLGPGPAGAGAAPGEQAGTRVRSTVGAALRTSSEAATVLLRLRLDLRPHHGPQRGSVETARARPADPAPRRRRGVPKLQRQARSSSGKRSRDDGRDNAGPQADRIPARRAPVRARGRVPKGEGGDPSGLDSRTPGVGRISDTPGEIAPYDGPKCREVTAE